MNFTLLANVDISSPYILIISGSVVLVLSYLYNILASRTNIPSVIMLILTGILIQQGLVALGHTDIDLMPLLEILGIIGLIMIVLEAALDLELNKEKLPLIGKTAMVALACLIVSAGLIAYVLQAFITMEYLQALLYATPLAIMSSAIIIPSVTNLIGRKREFMIYESTFSDIIGIMVFYFIISLIESGGSKATLQFGIGFLVTLIVAIVASYILVFFFKDIKGHKLFLLIAVLLLLYSLGKLLHLSPLLIILVFGLALSNHQMFFKIFKNSFEKDDPIEKVEKNFHLITAETAFVVRTFFFVIFGMTIQLSSLISLRVALISLCVIAILYGVRFIVLKLAAPDFLKPELWIAPRGLITILLFFAIPTTLQIEGFDSGILLYVILISSVIMSIALIRDGNRKVVEKDLSQPEVEKTVTKETESKVV